MLRTDGYVFAVAITAAIDKFNSNRKEFLRRPNFDLEEPRLASRQAAGVSFDKDRELRYSRRLKSEYTRYLRCIVRGLKGSPVANKMAYDGTSSFALTVEWLVNAFLAAPGDEERRVIVDLAALKLAENAEPQANSWYH